MSDASIELLSAKDLLRNRTFLWKEIRQIAPLLFAMCVIGVALAIAHAFARQYFQLSGYRPEIPLLVIPALFATGAGAILIGQERDQGTMRWLSSLPIRPRALVLHKLVLAIVALTVLWLFVFPLASLVQYTAGAEPDRPWQTTGTLSTAWMRSRYQSLVPYSFMILTAGFFSAWKIKNPFGSLVLLLCLALTPLIAMDITSRFVDHFATLPPKVIGIIWLAYTSLFAIGFAILGYWQGIKRLSPQSPPRPAAKSSLTAKSNSTAVQSVSGFTPIRSYATGLAPVIWQTACSAKQILIGLSMAMIAGAWFTSASLVVFQFTGLVATCWLAVMVFKNDGGHKKIRFFADRGISANTVYWGRHLVGISICSLAVVIYIVSMYWSHRDERELSPLAIMLLLVAIYSVSQWISQLFRMVTVASIVAPIASLLLVGWLVMCATEFDTPIWLLVLLILTPMVVTRMIMQRYMDGQDRPRSFLVAALMLVAFLLVPLLPAIGTVMSVREMSQAQRQTLLAEIPSGNRKVPTAKIHQTDYQLAYYSNDLFAATADEDAMPMWPDQPKTMAEIKPWHVYEDIRDLPADTPITLLYAQPAMHALAFHRTIAESVAKEDPKQAVENLRPWLEFCAHVVRGSRQNERIFAQEQADLMEAQLVETLSSDLLKPSRGEPWYIDIVGCLPSIQQRSAARRRAVLVIWQSWLRQQERPQENAKRSRVNGKPTIPPKYKMANYSLTKLYSRHAPAIADRMQTAYVDRLIQILLDAASGPPKTNPDWARELSDHLYWEGEVAETVYSPSSRSVPAAQSIRHTSAFPAALWGMEWENQIQQLRIESGIPEPAEVNNE